MIIVHGLSLASLQRGRSIAGRSITAAEGEMGGNKMPCPSHCTLIDNFGACSNLVSQYFRQKDHQDRATAPGGADSGVDARSHIQDRGHRGRGCTRLV